MGAIDSSKLTSSVNNLNSCDSYKIFDTSKISNNLQKPLIIGHYSSKSTVYNFLIVILTIICVALLCGIVFTTHIPSLKHLFAVHRTFYRLYSILAPVFTTCVISIAIYLIKKNSINN